MLIMLALRLYKLLLAISNCRAGSCITFVIADSVVVYLHLRFISSIPLTKYSKTIGYFQFIHLFDHCFQYHLIKTLFFLFPRIRFQLFQISLGFFSNSINCLKYLSLLIFIKLLTLFLYHL